MALTQTEKAARLGISANYLSMIYHGKRLPSVKLAEAWKDVTGKGYEWWAKAKVSQIQKILDAVE
jgi:transcriptional regulator with XRE-family HTH domain